MNEIPAVVTVYSNFLKLKYRNGNESYAIEVPKTKNNSFLIDGDIIIVKLGILLDDEQFKRKVEANGK